MGHRAFIQIDSINLENPVILYGHWSGDDSEPAVRNVLARTDRIGDPSYLAAQIFYEFSVVLGKYDGGIGFGIESGHLTSEMGNVPNVYVNADTGEYTVNDVTNSDFAVQYSRFTA
jgi:hypothetical protein